MYALFTAIPLVGHLNPLIRQAEELQRRGWRVAIASAREMRAHVASEAPGLPFVDLGELGPIAASLRRNEEAASADPNFVRGTMRIVQGLFAVWPLMFDGLTSSLAADRPDVVVIDLFSSAGFAAADAAGVPFIVNNPDLLAAISVKLLPPADHLPLMLSGRSIHDIGWRHRLIGPVSRRLAAVVASATIGRKLNALRRSRGLPAVDLHVLLRGRPILVNGAFGLEYERPLPPLVEMVGPMIPARLPPLDPALDAWLTNGPPVVYVSLGTLAVGPPAQLEKMIAAFSGNRFRVLWSMKGGLASRLLAPLPSSITMLDWGPPPPVILAHPNVKAFVSHCGINSVHESLHAGTPIVGIPMFADQRDMAIRVFDAGAGLWLDKRSFTAEALRGAVMRVIEEPAFRAAIPAVQAAFARAGGLARAADLIEQTAALATTPPRR